MKEVLKNCKKVEDDCEIYTYKQFPERVFCLCLTTGYSLNIQDGRWRKEAMNKKQKKMLIRIIVACVLIVVLSFLPVEGYLEFALYMIPYVVIGYDIIKKAFKGIRNKQVFDENFLMAVATIGAILLKDYKEGTAVMLFYQIGELFQSYAVGKSRRNISELMDIRPDYANMEIDGKLEKVDPDEVEIGSVILVQPGEKVPIDGVILGRKYNSEYQCPYR